jgi:glycine cleavage system H protein
MVVEGLLYTKEHEWAKVDGDIATVGITDYAQQMLGEIVFVELPALEKEFHSHDEIAVVESSKAASDFYSPVTGKIVEVNSVLQSEPELINRACYTEGWICKLQITDNKSIEGLMDAKQYQKFLKGL